MNTIEREQQARHEFERTCEDFGTDVIAEENAILSVGCEFLPPEAIAVLDGGKPTAEYWEFLKSQTEQAQAEHDAEVARGHEWCENEDRLSEIFEDAYFNTKDPKETIR